RLAAIAPITVNVNQPDVASGTAVSPAPGSSPAGTACRHEPAPDSTPRRDPEIRPLAKRLPLGFRPLNVRVRHNKMPHYRLERFGMRRNMHRIHARDDHAGIGYLRRISSVPAD